MDTSISINIIIITIVVITTYITIIIINIIIKITIMIIITIQAVTTCCRKNKSIYGICRKKSQHTQFEDFSLDETLL